MRYLLASTVPRNTELDLPDRVLKQLDSTYPIFKTSVSRRFQFGTSVKDDYPRSLSKYSVIQMTSAANITKRDPTFVGVLTLDGSSPIFLAGDTHALVVLSEAEYSERRNSEIIMIGAQTSRSTASCLSNGTLMDL